MTETNIKTPTTFADWTTLPPDSATADIASYARGIHSAATPDAKQLWCLAALLHLKRFAQGLVDAGTASARDERFASRGADNMASYVLSGVIAPESFREIIGQVAAGHAETERRRQVVERLQTLMSATPAQAATPAAQASAPEDPAERAAEAWDGGKVDKTKWASKTVFIRAMTRTR